MTEHYFSADPASPAQRRTIAFAVGGRDYEVAAASGVFSADRLDPGTAVLLRTVPRASGAAGASGGTLLDLGCGYGPIACVLATERPAATVWAIDVNERALDLAAGNAGSLGLDGRMRVARPDDVPADIRFDEIWSNPPIRIGKPALHQLLRRWLPRLAEGGTAWLVVSKHLGSDSLQRWLAEQGWRCDRHTSVKGYRVLAVRR